MDKKQNVSNCVVNEDDQDWGSSGQNDISSEYSIPLVSKKKKTLFPQKEFDKTQNDLIKS